MAHDVYAERLCERLPSIAEPASATACFPPAARSSSARAWRGPEALLVPGPEDATRERIAAFAEASATVPPLRERCAEKGERA
jgi:hypothetical protein